MPDETNDVPPIEFVIATTGKPELTNSATRYTTREEAEEVLESLEDADDCYIAEIRG